MDLIGSDMVTVHSVLSNTLRDAQKRQKSRFALLASGFSRKNRVKTPRGTVAVNSNLICYCWGG